MAVEHAALTDPELHEPIGIAAAGADEVYVADGAASGAWTTIESLLAHLIVQGHLSGLTLSNSAGDVTNDIDIAVGEATDDDRTSHMRLASAFTKRLDATWVVGTNQGGLDTGVIANAWYHVFLIQRSDTGVVDALFSLNESSPTMPANYDRQRRIGSIYRTGGAIKLFTQVADEFLWTTAVLDVDDNDPGTSAVLRTLTVPTGLKVVAFGNAALFSTATDSLGLITAPDQADVAPSETATPLADLRADSSSDTADFQHMECRTNISAQIRTRCSFSAATTDLRIVTEGWLDTRGRG